jgi:DNA repair exonuclease SbcCD ATPase subunit
MPPRKTKELRQKEDKKKTKRTTTMLSIVFSDPGLFIGLGFVILATVLLPGRVRWYVFTAGIAVVAFRGYQIYWARGRLKELDKERDQLRGELQSLRERHTELENTHNELVLQLEQIKVQRDELIKQRQALDETSATYAADKERLDTELEKRKEQAKQLREDTQPIVDFLENFADAERLTANVPQNI